VYRFRDDLAGSLGYARFRARGRSGNTVDEDRFWQQLEWTAPKHGVSVLKLRLRLEQRLLDVGDDTGIVARLQARLVRPLGNATDRRLVVGIESFFDLTDTDWGASSGLSQNRVFAGIAQRLAESLTLEYGYMNQYFFRDDAADISNHLAILHARVRF